MYALIYRQSSDFMNHPYAFKGGDVKKLIKQLLNNSVFIAILGVVLGGLTVAVGIAIFNWTWDHNQLSIKEKGSNKRRSYIDACNTAKSLLVQA